MVDGRHQCAVVQAEYRLDQTGYAGRAVGVTDVAFHAAERATAGHRLAIAAVGVERGPQPGELDGVADVRGGGMTLHIGDLIGRDAGHGDRVGDAAGLRPRARRGIARLHPPVVGDAEAGEHRPHRVAVSQRRVEAFEHHRADRVAEERAARRRVERADPAVDAADQPLLVAVTEVGEGERRRTGDCHVALTDHNGLSCLGHRDQRAAARRRHGDGWATKVEQERQPGGYVVLLVADLGEEHADRVERLGEAAAPQVVDQIAVDAAGGKDPGPLPVGVVAAGVAGLFQRRPGRLDEDPMLRIHQVGLARPDAPERGVERVGAVDHLGRRHPRGMRKHLLRDTLAPQPAGRERGERVDARAQVRPERVEVSGPGKAAGHPDDRHSGVAGTPGRTPDRAIGGSGWCGRAGPAPAVCGHRPQGRRLENLDDRQSDAEARGEHPGEPGRGERVAARREEVVVGARRPATEHLAPGRGEAPFGRAQRVGGRFGCGRGVVVGRWRQRGQVELARVAVADRHRGEADEVPRPGVLGQVVGHPLAQPGEHRRRGRARVALQVGDEAGRLPSPPVRHRPNHGPRDTVLFGQYVFDRPQRDLEAPHLDHVARPPEYFEVAPGTQPRPVTGAVEGLGSERCAGGPRQQA